MPSVKFYRREDQNFPYEADALASILAYVNTGNSDTMGGGFGVFGAGYYGDWTVTYDETTNLLPANCWSHSLRSLEQDTIWDNAFIYQRWWLTSNHLDAQMQ